MYQVTTIVLVVTWIYLLLALALLTFVLIISDTSYITFDKEYACASYGRLGNHEVGG